MLIGLGVRDVVLIETLDLSIRPGLTALTGETGAGKSIILDALGLASGARADAGLRGNVWVAIIFFETGTVAASTDPPSHNAAAASAPYLHRICTVAAP